MRKSRKFLSVLLSVLLVLSTMTLLGSVAFAADEIASGALGDNLTWTLSKDFVLTISGTGDMAEFEDDAPWIDAIENLVAAEYGYDSMDAMGEAYYAGTFEFDVFEVELKYLEFSKKISTVIIEEGVTSICKDAFSDLKLSELTLPASCTKIGSYAYDAEALQKLTVKSDKAVEGISVPAFREEASFSTYASYLDYEAIDNANGIIATYTALYDFDTYVKTWAEQALDMSEEEIEADFENIKAQYISMLAMELGVSASTFDELIDSQVAVINKILGTEFKAEDLYTMIEVEEESYPTFSEAFNNAVIAKFGKPLEELNTLYTSAIENLGEDTVVAPWFVISAPEGSETAKTAEEKGISFEAYEEPAPEEEAEGSKILNTLAKIIQFFVDLINFFKNIPSLFMGN